MWFKNIQVFRFTKPFDMDENALHDQLAEQAFTPCGSQDVSRTGWVRPIPGNEKHGQDGLFLHSSNGFQMLAAKRQDKVLPAAVVNEQVQEKVDDIEAEQGRKVGRKERQEIKDEMIFSLLPRAFVRSRIQHGYLDNKRQMLVVNSASAKGGEEFCEGLRAAVGSLPVIPLTTMDTPAQVMTSWLLSGNAPEGFELGTECELRDPSDEGGVIRCKNQLLTADEIRNHIQAGMYVSKIELVSKSGISCLVDDKFTIKRIRYGDMIQDKADEVYTSDATERFDVDFSIMTLELAELINGLLAAFGGENTGGLGE
ncbi:recombination-associated protein RdgC [Porticoccus sp. W117]|uniref:recombination-associated protein RdgC n=1 Tax=Porticoccus sp. W117 TaxID=3054777 RepID=UPI00259218D0|nr:recombination-associated protein RdgC [Porticoccus sp. W117]MDM3869891.1 recombination-associated protein RdgC [Porticoccus sp. W117]